MDNLELMQSNGTPIAIKKGCPLALKSNRIKNATCYYAEVAPKQYILFQNRNIGPFSIWLSDYLLHKPITLTSHMESYGVEFHQMLEGSIMFSFDKGKNWFRETAGDYNVLVNGELHTSAAFTGSPVRTFDIHVEDDYFQDFVILHPELSPLLDALANRQSTSLFASQTHSSLVLRYLLTQIITAFKKDIKGNKEKQDQTNQELMDLLEESITMMVTSPSTKGNPYKFLQDDLDKIVQVKDYITDNIIHPDVLKQATCQHYINKNKLTKGFQLLFGHNPKQFVIREKLERAKVFLLEVPAASIQEIAMSVGYTDAAYFSQLFYRFEYMRIEDYRKVHLKKYKK